MIQKREGDEAFEKSWFSGRRYFNQSKPRIDYRPLVGFYSNTIPPATQAIFYTSLNLLVLATI